VRVTRRRQRRPDSLASPDAIRHLLDRLRSSLPEVIPKNERHLVRILRAARHVERYPASDTKRGRPSNFDRAQLLQIGSHLRTILERETSGRVSFSSFVDHYLRVLDFPSDVLDALKRGDLNLFEAEQLARLSPARLKVTQARAHRLRADLLNSHLQARLSGARLRARVNEILAATQDRDQDVDMEEVVTEDLEDFDPHDPTHLFFDEIKRLGFALRDIRPEDVTDELLEEFLTASEPLWGVITKIEKRRQPVRTEKLSL
jgi:hypothetical protein